MIYNVHDFPIIHGLQKHWELFASEVSNIQDKSEMKRERSIWVNDPNYTRDFIGKIGDNSKWILAWDNGGDWWNYPMIINDTILPGKTRELCSHACGFLSKIKGIKVAGFSKLNAGGRIFPHIDNNGTPKCLAYHLGLSGVGHLSAEGYDKTLIQSPGNDLIIDTEYQHSVINDTLEDRVILYVLFYKDQHMVSC